MSIETIAQFKYCLLELNTLLSSSNKTPDNHFHLSEFRNKFFNSEEELSDLLSLLHNLLQSMKKSCPRHSSENFPILNKQKNQPEVLSEVQKNTIKDLSNIFLKISDLLQSETFQKENTKIFNLLNEGKELIKGLLNGFKSENHPNEDSLTIMTGSDLVRSPLVSEKKYISQLFDSFSEDTTKEIESNISFFFLSSMQRLNNKLSELSEKFKNLQQKISDFSSCSLYLSLRKTRDFLKSYDLEKSRDSSLILILTELLSLSHRPIINPKVEILIPADPQDFPDSLLVQNFELKSEILKFEGDRIRIKNLEKDLKNSTEKIAFLEKINKEMQKPDSDDSLDLDSRNIKSEIEIQQLREALHSMSEKYEQEKENFIKDMIESRQDMETQIFRTQNEKNYLEVKLANSEKFMQEAQREKERTELITAGLKKELEMMKDFMNSEQNPRGSAFRRRSSEIHFNPSYDFEFSESLEKSSSNSYYLLQDEINEMVKVIKENHLIEKTGVEGISVVKQFIEQIKKCKDIILLEYPFIEIEGFDNLILSTFHRLKNRISLRETAEYRRPFSERLEKNLDPDPKVLLMQVQADKAKLLSKKHEIFLHKQQIAALKTNIRELQNELDKAFKISNTIKSMIIDFLQDIPVQGISAEESIEVLMRTAGLNQNEIRSLQTDRKSKKSKQKFLFFG